MAAVDPHLPYQPQIDGLRAVAVLSVVLYHFGVPGLPGGFTGVDVFFVISGFLIGGILWRERQATGRMALGRFYLRRIRRLAPAYFAMLAATALAAWFVLLPFEFREFGKEAIAATLWLSNVLFFRSAGYFDPGAEAKPLLHTWSLSVEEQFYLILPLTLILLARWPRLTIPALGAAWAASLAACVALTPAQPDATFYLFPFRAWELLTGVLLAILGARWRGHAAASLLGLLLVGGAVLLIPPGAGFPGWVALVPVAGTALVLSSLGHDNPVNRALALPPLVGVGLISYSLYLWHWPVLILSRAWGGPLPAPVWLAVALVLSWASWRWVERPFRRPGAVGAPGLLALCGTAAMAALAFGAWVWRADGLPDRFSPSIRAHIAASADFLQDWSRCTTPTTGPFAGSRPAPSGRTARRN